MRFRRIHPRNWSWGIIALLLTAFVLSTASVISAKAEDKPVTIYFVGIVSPADPFHGIIARGAERAGKDLGAKVVYIFPDKVTLSDYTIRSNRPSLPSLTASSFSALMRRDQSRSPNALTTSASSSLSILRPRSRRGHYGPRMTSILAGSVPTNTPLDGLRESALSRRASRARSSAPSRSLATQRCRRGAKA
jgi:hypothetical protein